MTTTKPAKPTETGRTAYLVLGMHRSGTSAVTQLLALAGASLPQNVMAGDEHNAKGYFEPWKIAILNDGRLRAAGAAWDDVFAFPFKPLARKDERTWLNRAETLFAEEYGAAPFPLLKDPRVTVLMPFWREVLADLDVAARCVIPVRHPLAVAGSLSRRNGFAPEKSVLLWSAYMLAAEAHTRDLPRAFVSYDDLLSDWRGVVARIEAAHGASLPAITDRAAKAIDRFLTPELRHNAAGGGLADLGWAGDLTQGVLAWFDAAATGAAPDTGALDKAARDLAQRGRDVGVLVSPVTRDLDAARAELLDLRQRIAFERDKAAQEGAAQLAAHRAEVRRLETEIEALRREAADAVFHLDSILAAG
jgi:hypothetical protein